jgi:hypothetical protein
MDPTTNLDPTTTDPDHYKVIFENDRVRVLEYEDKPGDRTNRHRHPDSVMYTLGTFRRRITSGDRQVEVELESGQARWLGAQEHSGENIGETASHAIFVELKDVEPGDVGLTETAAGSSDDAGRLGPE